VSFRSNDKTFILVTLHIIYRQPKERIPELKAIAEWLADWAKDVNGWDHNLITLGDFNIDRKDDELYKAFISSGLEVPKDLLDLPRTIFKTDAPKNVTFYDQIAWFNKDDSVPALSLKYSLGGNFDFTKTALKSLNLTTKELSYRISDHYPLWVEFDVRE
jgi:endonuclease/exonuclease/phosphatase family metal-dependent hydrolase